MQTGHTLQSMHLPYQVPSHPLLKKDTPWDVRVSGHPAGSTTKDRHPGEKQSVGFHQSWLFCYQGSKNRLPYL